MFARRSLEDGVKGNRERIPQDGLLITDGIRYGKPPGFMARDLLGKAPGGGRAIAMVYAPCNMAGAKIEALRQFALLAELTGRQTTSDTGQPGIEQHPLTDTTTADLVADACHHANHLVSQNLRPGDHRGHGVVDPAVHEHLFVVAAAEAAQSGFGDQPIWRR